MAAVPAPSRSPADLIALRAAVRAGALLGWTSVLAVLVSIAAGIAVQRTGLVVAFTVVGAAAHLGFTRLPWAELLPGERGRRLVDLWGASVLAASAGLVLVAGGRSRLDLLLLLVVPFLAIAHDRGRAELTAWLVAASGAFAVSVLAAPDRLPSGEAVLHLVLLAGATGLALSLARALRRQADARAEAIRRAELEGAMLSEAHHRVKNSLQVVADLLLLGRPDEPGEGAALDAAAARIRAIAAVHQTLARRSGGRVDVEELLRAVVDATGAEGVAVVAEPLELPFAQAQHLGVVVNELVTNAVRHGHPPVAVTLQAGPPVVLGVGDGGPGPTEEALAHPGLGLTLVRQLVDTGLRGGLARAADGALTVTFEPPEAADARPGR